MSDFGTMRSRIAREMKRGELTSAGDEIRDAILSAIKHMENRRFTWNEFLDTTVTASASTAYMNFSDFSVRPIIIDSIKVRISNRDYPLIRKGWSELEAIDAGQWSGYPDWYAIHSRRIRLYPIPQANYPLVMSGVRDLTEISLSASNSATNGWMTDGEALIRMTAKAMLFRDELRAPELSGQFMMESERVMRELQRETSAQVSSGRVRPRFM